MTNEEVRAAESDLTRLIEGPVIRAGEPGYAAALNIDNGRISHTPYLVAIPSSTGDLANIVRYCSERALRLTTKSGGHSAAGYCLNSDAIVIDLSSLNSISSKDRGSKLTVGVGARWRDVYDYLGNGKSRYMVVGGGCGSVGVGGYLLGGGYSFLSRSYGLASDSITRMEVVGADGSVYSLDGTQTDRDAADLYWALRGGGGGNFAVVAKADLRLHKTQAPNLMVGQVTFGIDRVAEVLSFYNSWVVTLPYALAVYGMIRRFPDPRKGGEPTLSLHLNPIYNGSLAEGISLLKPLTDMQPMSAELFAMTLPQWENHIGNGTAIEGRSAYIRSAVLDPGSLTSGVADILTNYLTDAPSNDSFIVWTHTGGKIKDPDDGHSCFAHREAEFAFELKSIWDRSLPQNARRNIEWAIVFPTTSRSTLKARTSTTSIRS